MEIVPATDPPPWASDLFELCHEEALKAREVYPPSDDSFLLLEALELDFRQYPPPSVCLEVGPGSGICLLGAQRLWPNALVVGAEKSPFACELSQRLSPKALIVQSSLAVGLRLQVDVGIFNPPYVVTPKEEMDGLGISISWAGGHRGREVLDAFLPSLKDLLAPQGRWYLCGIVENDLPDLRQRLTDLGLHPEVVIERTCGIEDLWVLKIVKK